MEPINIKYQFIFLAIQYMLMLCSVVIVSLPLCSASITCVGTEVLHHESDAYTQNPCPDHVNAIYFKNVQFYIMYHFQLLRPLFTSTLYASLLQLSPTIFASM